MSRRSSIAMTAEEVQRFLDEERVLTVASAGKDGWPHLMPLWYVVRDGECWAWTYAKSQKVVNLERESRCTLQVEAGDTYGELRGVMIKAACAIHREPEVVASVGTELARRYGGEGAHVTPAQASKRVALQFVTASIASWDHRKLAAA
jgi:general stress protein 26